MIHGSFSVENVVRLKKTDQLKIWRHKGIIPLMRSYGSSRLSSRLAFPELPFSAEFSKLESGSFSIIIWGSQNDFHYFLMIIHITITFLFFIFIMLNHLIKHKQYHLEFESRLESH